MNSRSLTEEDFHLIIRKIRSAYIEALSWTLKNPSEKNIAILDDIFNHLIQIRKKYQEQIGTEIEELVFTDDKDTLFRAIKSNDSLGTIGKYFYASPKSDDNVINWARTGILPLGKRALLTSDRKIMDKCIEALRLLGQLSDIFLPKAEDEVEAPIIQIEFPNPKIDTDIISKHPLPDIPEGDTPPSPVLGKEEKVEERTPGRILMSLLTLKIYILLQLRKLLLLVKSLNRKKKKKLTP